MSPSAREYNAGRIRAGRRDRAADATYREAAKLTHVGFFWGILGAVYGLYRKPSECPGGEPTLWVQKGPSKYVPINEVESAARSGRVTTGGM